MFGCTPTNYDAGVVALFVPTVAVSRPEVSPRDTSLPLPSPFCCKENYSTLTGGCVSVKSPHGPRDPTEWSLHVVLPRFDRRGVREAVPLLYHRP